MYRGYPIGYFLFWENGFPGEHKVIGTGQKQKAPRLLIVDGQQRLASLYTVTKAVPIVSKDFRHARIRIAFNPIEERFEVTNPVIEKDVEWISDISEIWKPEMSSYTFINKFLNRLGANRLGANREIADEKRTKIANSITRLEKLLDYPLTALEISSSVDEDRVAEIFVRINSKGTPLNQADFILTLMSVFWDDGRKQLEEFCRQAKKPPVDNRPSPYNHYLTPSPDQLLRPSVALGFRRARLEHVYSLLRGKDLQTRQFSVEQREKQFDILREAQDCVLNLQNWHDFFKVLKRAGYQSGKLISSEMTIVYTYAMWLIGKMDYCVDPYYLREVMARWFFMVALKGRYTGSPESRMEQDLALLRAIDTAEGFVKVLDQQINAIFTRDYWEVTLPNELETAAARSTGQFAFYAALCLLDANVLYSKMKVSELLDPTIKSKKKALERHHLFPRRYLQKIGTSVKHLINQTANYALVEWSDNIAISDKAPKDYVPQIEAKFTGEELQKMYTLHALPERWYEMEYTTFLNERRKLMADIIRRGFMKLKENI